MTTQSQSKQKATVPLPYKAYLIRLWNDSDQTGWRASAQSTQSGDTIRFGSLDALFTFLQDQTHDQSAEPPTP
jgi:hypothetical protein